MHLRDQTFAHALAVFTTLLALACGPSADGTTDTDVTETAATDPAATDPGTGPTTTDDDTDSTTGSEACVAAEPTADASIRINFGTWPIEEGEPSTIHVSAACAVDSVTNEDGVVGVGLSCTDGGPTYLPIEIGVTVPADFAVDLAVEATVTLTAYWQSDALSATRPRRVTTPYSSSWSSSGSGIVS